MEGDHDLVELARIYSRAELICYISALEAEGLHTFVTGNHYGSATQEIIAIGGYLVRVPAAQLHQAVSFTAELRIGTEPIDASRTQRRRIWMLVALAFATGSVGMITVGFPTILMAPLPMTSPGDYRSKSGKMIQLR